MQVMGALFDALMASFFLVSSCSDLLLTATEAWRYLPVEY